MATSSIFANFNISDAKTAEAFAKALSESEKDLKQSDVSNLSVNGNDEKEILAFLKRKNLLTNA